MRVTPDRIDECIELGARMHAESAFSFLDYNRNKLREMVQFYIESPNHFANMKLQNGEVVGMLFGYVSEYYFGRDKIACDILWYVAPEHRGSTIGVRLLKEFEEWARLKGVKEVCIGISTNVDTGKTGNMLERLNFNHVGGTYKLRL